MDGSTEPKCKPFSLGTLPLPRKGSSIYCPGDLVLPATILGTDDNFTLGQVNVDFPPLNGTQPHLVTLFLHLCKGGWGW